jgi:putative ABC transport system permease protein
MTPRAPLWLVRQALRFYPPQFHQRYAADMEQQFADMWQDRPSLVSRVVFLTGTLANLTLSALAERRHTSFEGTSPVKKGGLVFGWLQDVQYALRLLRRQPGFSLFVVLTMAIGIGANVAVFSVVDGVLLKPLPFADSERLVAIWGRFDPESGFNFPAFPLSNPEFVDYRAEARALEDVAAWTRLSVTVGGPGAEPERASAAAVSGNLFSLLRVAPALGRTFTREEDSPKGSPAAILSTGYWRSRFGGDPSIVGRTFLMNSKPVTIVGVMPESFSFPGPNTRIWVPLGIDAANPGNRKAHGIRAIGRLAPEASIESARAEMRTIMSGWKARYPDVHTGHYLFMRPMIDEVAGSIRPALLALLGATGFVLLIACANVTNLLLARGEARIREMAIRGALGARRGRLVRLTLLESSILSLMGGALGLAFAAAGVRLFLSLDASAVPRATDVGLDGRMLGFALLMTLASALLSGVVPALRGASPMLQGTLRDTSLNATAGTGRQFVRRSLVTIEVALCVVLVLGAALMLRSFSRLQSVDPGFRPSNVLMAAISLPRTAYADPAKVNAFYGSLMTRLRSAPGIRAASASSGVPLWDDAGVWDFEIEGRPSPRPGETAWNAAATVARDGFFETLGIPLARGRFFTAHDDERSMPVAVINETMARRFFPGEDPIGRRIRVKGVTNPRGWMTVVGIARDIHDEGLDTLPRPSYYLAQSQAALTIEDGYPSMFVLMRIDGSIDSARTALASAVRELDAGLPLFDVQTVDAVLDRSMSRPRFTTSLLAAFAAIGLLLGATGIYGVLAYTVTRSTQEIGIRRALGAPTAGLVAHIVRSGMQPVVAGLVLGIVVSFWSTKLLTTDLYGIASTDPSTYVLAVAGVVTVALLACLLPARRALRVSPLVALRSE